MKRAAESQLTKDNVDDEDDSQVWAKLPCVVRHTDTGHFHRNQPRAFRRLIHLLFLVGSRYLRTTNPRLLLTMYSEYVVCPNAACLLHRQRCLVSHQLRCRMAQQKRYIFFNVEPMSHIDALSLLSNPNLSLGSVHSQALEVQRHPHLPSLLLYLKQILVPNPPNPLLQLSENLRNLSQRFNPQKAFHFSLHQIQRHRVHHLHHHLIPTPSVMRHTNIVFHFAV